MLKIHNSLTGQKEEFIPVEGNRVRLYVCGMTVYDYCHLGHARVMVGFDTIVRYLRYRGYDVTYVRNITDIDDKIIDRANELGESIESLTNRFIGYMNEDLDALSVLKPDFEPRATEFISQIIDMIAMLIEREFAYVAENGDVYYRVRRFEDYGKLSGRRLDELMAGARIAPDEMKDDPLDFVLWKSSKPHEPSWDSPWGKGRPGWHIECSAMSTSLLGNHFDIHGGGLDLLFPHHENEIAQSEAATEEKFVNVWMHNGYLEINAEKMSKSLKNFLTIREILAYDDRAKMGETLRFMFLMSHYRSPLKYRDSSLEKSKSALSRIYSAIHKAEQSQVPLAHESDVATISKFRKVMDDDFNTSDALAVVFDCVRELNRALNAGSEELIGRYHRTLRELTNALGVVNLEAARFLGVEQSSDDDGGIRDLVLQREQARRDRQWQLADDLRKQLTQLGVELEDRPDGTSTWRKI